MRIYPAVHYTMGGLWVDYNLMSNVPGLFVLGEANFSDHGANRLGASALMQGLADGYFVLPYTIGDYLAPLLGTQPVPTDDPAFTRRRGTRSTSRCDRLLSINGNRTRSTTSTASSARSCGTTAAWRAASRASRRRSPRSPRSARSSGRTCACSARTRRCNQSLEKAGRVADFLEFGELMCRDALHREECCGGHFREEHQTEEGEALRDDEHFAYVARVGVRRASAPSPSSTRSRSSSSTSTRRPALLQVEDPDEHAQTHAHHAARSGARPGPTPPGAFETYDVPDVSPDMSFLEMLDILNERLIADGKEPIAFDHDCREGICGSCGMMINGQAARPRARHRHVPAAHAQVPRRRRRSTIEPWRAAAFPIIKDLVVDRSAFDRIIEAGGYITAPHRRRARRQPHPVPKEVADAAMDAAACIGCGACVAACPNGAAQLFTVGEARSTSTCCRRARPSAATARSSMVETMETLLRLVHEPRRVRGGVPEGDLASTSSR